MTISVIVPTLGRAGLARTLRSIREQRPDELIVVADQTGNVQHAAETAARFDADVFLTCPHGHEGQGYAQRNLGIEKAAGSHLAFLDDDDTYTDGALDTMRQEACDVPVIFRMDHHLLGVIWTRPELRFGNVGTPMFLVPNTRVGKWAAHSRDKWPAEIIARIDSGEITPKPFVGGDYTFIRETCDLQGEPLWNPTVVAQIRP